MDKFKNDHLKVVPSGHMDFNLGKLTLMVHSHQIICSRLSDRTAKKLGAAPIASNGLKPV